MSALRRLTGTEERGLLAWQWAGISAYVAQLFLCRLFAIGPTVPFDSELEEHFVFLFRQKKK